MTIARYFLRSADFFIYNVGLEADGVSRPVWVYEVSGQYFELTGIKPFLGRLLQRDDDVHSDASDAVVLSWSTWKSDFGADPNIVCKKVRINKHPYTVVGVTPEGFLWRRRNFLSPTFSSLWPTKDQSEASTIPRTAVSGNCVTSIVRLKDGVTPGASTGRTEYDRRSDETATSDWKRMAWSQDWFDPGFAGEFLGGPLNGFLTGVMVLAGIVLLAACANLGGLFASRTLDRTREIAIRIAIGSTRGRILRQVLVEAMLISIVAGLCAWGLAWLGLAGLASWHPPTPFPFRLLVLPQPSLFVVALLIAVTTAVLFGLMPLRQIFKTDPNDAMKSVGSRGSTGRGWALRDLLLAAQIALCCVTVTAAFVSLRGLTKAMNMDVGFNPANAVRTEFDLGWAGYNSDAAAHFQRELLNRVSHLPGVQAAGYADSTPLSLEITSSGIYSETTTDFRNSE